MKEMLVPLVVAALGAGGLGALIDRFLLRKPVTAKIAAETRAMDATTTDTISSIVKGLLVTMEHKLEECEAGHLATRKELSATRQELDQVRDDLEAQSVLTVDLTAEVSRLTQRLIAAEQQENQ